MKIKYLIHSEIVFKKWDLCIINSFNGIIYAYSWYLSIINEEWEALVYGDYEIVMPLTPNSKFGINYLIQPIFCQQLGVFSTNKLDKNILTNFINAIPPKYKFIKIQVNKYNHLEDLEYNYYPQVTYELDLINDYQKIYKRYSQNTKRNIKKAISNKITIVRGLAVNEIIDLKRNNAVKSVSDYSYFIIRKIISFAVLHRIGEIYGAYDKNNTLCSASFFITINSKTIYLYAGSNQIGKQDSAMFLLVDQYIKNNSEKNITLDFEGSKIPGLARFYNGFGAQPYNYNTIIINKMPWPLKYYKGK